MPTPWLDDACSLIDAFRSGVTSPVEQLQASLDAIAASGLNAFSFLDPEGALDRARTADVKLPFGGLPIGLKELDRFSGWPATEASLALKDRLSDHNSTAVDRLLGAGANPVGLTTSSEFGGLNVSVSRLNGVTRNPWHTGRTTGGSSAGSSAAVAGGLVALAGAGDGGGSIRIPAGFCGLFGMKGTAGRIPRGPRTLIGPLTIVQGCVARSVRDAARWYDVCAGFDSRDPYSLPKAAGWEANLGSYAETLSGKKVAISPTLGSAVVRPEIADMVIEFGGFLAREAGLEEASIDVELPEMGLEWLLANAGAALAELGDRWPACRDELTAEMALFGDIAAQSINLEMLARSELARTAANEAMADVFDQVDFVIAATNPDVAYPADCTLNTMVGETEVGPENNGALTIPANIVGNPAMSIPVGTFDGLPAGLQVIGRHHEDALLFDLALMAERSRPWPLVAPGSPF